MKGTQEHRYVAYLAAYLLPTVFHVLWFVHTYGQFDLQILVGARLSHSHLVEFRLLGAVRSGVEDNLHSKRQRQQKVRLHNYQRLYPGGESLISSCATFSNTNRCVCQGWRLCVFVFV